jgi:hypothetical protein
MPDTQAHAPRNHRYIPHQLEPARIHLGRIPQGYPGIVKTVEQIKELIRQGAKDFFVRQRAIDILIERNVPPKDYAGEIRTLFEWVKDNIRYTKDPFQVEVLHSARRMLELRAGDCDDMSILLGSMLKAIGHPVRLAIAGFNPVNPRQFSHIYLEVNHQGRWVALDPTMPYPAGWAPPAPNRQIFHIEKESDKMAVTESELQGYFGEIDLGELADNPAGQSYQLIQTVDGLGNPGLSLTPVPSPATPVPWVRPLLVRMWQQGVRPRDPQVRQLVALLRRQRRLQRRSWARGFLLSAWRRGVQSRNQQIIQLARQLREWGILPPRTGTSRPGWTGIPSTPPTWYTRPPWWYSRPPVWAGQRPLPLPRLPGIPRLPGVPGLPAPRLPIPGFPQLPFVPLPQLANRFMQAGSQAAQPVMRAAVGPGGLLPIAARLPGQALRTATAAATAPARFVSSLFR